jgi:phosphoglycerol transferase MdoB-like AlkP superfamily enzyme
MKKSIDFLAAYLLYWLSYFLFFRIVFLIYHQSLSAGLDSSTIGGILWYGFWTDLIFSAGLCLVPALLFLLGTSLPGSDLSGISAPSKRFMSYGLKLYTSICLIFFTILCTADLELFRIWGYRMDASPLLYLNTPAEMLFSIGASPVWILSLLNILINLYFGLLYACLLHPFSTRVQHKRSHTATASVFSLAILLLLLPVWGKKPAISLHPHSNYFSKELFANQATVNIPWNFFYALKNDQERQNPYEYLPTTLADSLLNNLYRKKGDTQRVLNTRSPNVVLIIWESFTAKVSRHTGSLRGVTPRFDQLAEEGLLFTEFYASGDRSDKGLVALLSGYPAQPTTTLLSTPDKIPALPHLSQVFRKTAYHTAFYYGGRLAFANLQDYLQHAGYIQLVAGSSFDNATPMGRWGAHDEVVLQKLWDDIQAEKQPFFKTFFTLSSHEPFDIPVSPRFGKEGSSASFLSALHYTDSLIGNFIEKAKGEDWYGNTLFIIVGDHGHTYPGNSRVYEREKFHIPMLWIGGALESAPARISKTGSQTDLPASLLQQLELPADDFQWSKDLLNKEQQGFAHYFFYDGVGMLSDSSHISFDNIGKRLIEQEGNSHRRELEYAKAYLQKSYGDYLNK